MEDTQSETRKLRQGLLLALVLAFAIECILDWHALREFGFKAFRWDNLIARGAGLIAGLYIYLGRMGRNKGMTTLNIAAPTTTKKLR
jgi:hypothetical protein